MVRITVTPAAYAAIKGSLGKGANEPPPQRDAAGRFVIYVEETYVDCCICVELPAQSPALTPRELQRCHPETGRTGGNKGPRREAR